LPDARKDKHQQILKLVIKMLIKLMLMMLSHQVNTLRFN